MKSDDFNVLARKSYSTHHISVRINIQLNDNSF